MYLYYSAEIIYEIYELYLVVGEKNAISLGRFTFHLISIPFNKMHCTRTVIAVNHTIIHDKSNMIGIQLMPAPP